MVQSCGTRDSARALLNKEAGFVAAGRVVALEPSQRGGGVRSHVRSSARAHLNREVGSRAEGREAACGGMPCYLSLLHASTRGYPVYRVLTVAPRPTS
jgi:hypothetical protein